VDERDGGASERLVQSCSEKCVAIVDRVESVGHRLTASESAGERGQYSEFLGGARERASQRVGQPGLGPDLDALRI
jgi:hypothetical protein